MLHREQSGAGVPWVKWNRDEVLRGLVDDTEEALLSGGRGPERLGPTRQRVWLDGIVVRPTLGPGVERCQGDAEVGPEVAELVGAVVVFFDQAAGGEFGEAVVEDA